MRPVSEAKSAGIKVAVWDSGLDESAGDSVISNVMTDNYAAGQACGKRLAKLMNNSGKVLMLRHEVNHDSTTNREEAHVPEELMIKANKSTVILYIIFPELLASIFDIIIQPSPQYK